MIYCASYKLDTGYNTYSFIDVFQVMLPDLKYFQAALEESHDRAKAELGSYAMLYYIKKLV